MEKKCKNCIYWKTHGMTSKSPDKKLTRKCKRKGMFTHGDQTCHLHEIKDAIPQ